MWSHAPGGVLYAEDFDAPEPVASASMEPAPPAEPVVIVEPTFSLADLRRAAERAQEEGRTLARHEAELAADAHRTAALSDIAAALQQARDDLQAVAARSASATASTVLAAVAALLPAFARSRGRDEAATLLRLLLPAMSHEPQLTIRVHPTLIDALRDDLTVLAADNGATVSWVASDRLQPGDVSVRWEGGTMVRDTADLCARIAALVMPDATPPEMNQESQHGQ